MYYRRPQNVSSRRSRLQSSSKVIRLNLLLKYAFFGLIGLIFFSIMLIVWYSKDLPAPGKLSSASPHDSTKIMDKKDVTLYSIYKDYNRIYIPIDEMPKNLKDATIATEDKDFYKNKGFSMVGYLRSFKNLILYRRVMGGGSTLTQQLVKTVLLTSQQSFSRKIKELILAIQVDQRYSKDQILEMYLNDVSYGGTAVGVEAASNLYFGKHAKDLTLTESAFLAGLPQAPSYYSPFTSDNRAYVARTIYVIQRLYEEGYIPKKKYEESKKEIPNLKFTEVRGDIKAPHFVMYIREQLVKMFGEDMVERGNLKVITTLDYEIQKKNEEIIKTEIDKLKGYNVNNGAIMVMDPKTGAILSMVGSKDYFDKENGGNFNAAVSGLRQPGSSLKPIMYATAFEKGYTPATLIMDVETDFWTGDEVDKVYKPVNYDEKFRGPVQIRFALGNSLNIPAVKILAKVGIKSSMQKAYDMGIENWSPTTENMNTVGLSLVLGGREASLFQITNAYSVFANAGVKKEPFSILEVKDSNGKTIYKHDDVAGKQVLSPEVSFLISHILLDNNARMEAFGTSSWLVVSGKTVAVKTGTTDEKRDNWTIGYTPSYTVGVWVGNNDNSKMNPKIASGITGATPIWNKVISNILKGKKDEQFQKPENVIAMEVDTMSGGLAYGDSPKRTEYFVKGTEPTTILPIYKKVKISKHQNNKLANGEEINRGDYDIRDYIVFQESDPVSQDGKNRWQEGIDKWIKSTYAADKPQYYPPTETSDYKYGDSSSESSSPSPTPTLTSTPTPTLTPKLTEED